MAVELPVKIKVTGIPELKAGLGELQSSWNLQTQAIKGMVGALGATAVFAATISFLKSAHESAQQSRTSVTLLTSQLGYYSAALNDQADALSKSLFVQKADILAADQRLLVYTHEEGAIKRLIPGIIDLAKVKGIDLTAASNNVGLALKRADSAAAGHTITIRGLGVAFKATGTEAGNVAALEDALKKAVGGSAMAVADSLDGWSKLSFWIGKAKEDIGKLMFGVSSSERAYKDYTKNIAELALKQNQLNALNKINYEFFPGQKKQVEERINFLKTQVTGYEVMIGMGKKDAETKSKNAIADEENAKLQEEADNLTLQSKRNKLLKEKQDAISAGADIVLVNEVFGAKISKIDEEIAQKKEEKLKKEEEAVKKNIDTKEKLEKEYSDARFKNLEEIADADIKLQKKTIKEQFQLDLAAAKQMPLRFEKEIAIIQAKYKREIALAKLNGDSVVEIEAEKAQEVADIKTKEKAGQEHALGDTVKNLQTLASKHKEWLIAYKLAAISQATIDTYKSAESVYAGFSTIPVVGQALGIVGAAVAVAAGIANVQQIASQKANYGAIVTGGQYDKDTEPYLLSKGEIVYNPRHPDPALAGAITNSTSSTHNIQMGDIHIHGNADSRTVTEMGQITYKAVIAALKRAQNTGKISATGLTIRH